MVGVRVKRLSFVSSLQVVRVRVRVRGRWQGQTAAVAAARARPPRRAPLEQQRQRLQQLRRRQCSLLEASISKVEKRRGEE